jgi:hypothetical protein
MSALQVGHQRHDGHADQAGDEVRDDADHRRRGFQVGMDMQADAQQAEGAIDHTAASTRKAQLGLFWPTTQGEMSTTSAAR